MLWAGRNGLQPTPDILHLGCSYQLHPSHHFLSTWGVDQASLHPQVEKKRAGRQSHNSARTYLLFQLFTTSLTGLTKFNRKKQQKLTTTTTTTTTKTGFSCAMQMKGNTGNPRNGAIHWIYSGGLVMASFLTSQGKNNAQPGAPYSSLIPNLLLLTCCTTQYNNYVQFHSNQLNMTFLLSFHLLN